MQPPVAKRPKKPAKVITCTTGDETVPEMQMALPVPRNPLQCGKHNARNNIGDKMVYLRWTVSEIACILNWVDYCRINKEDYEATVVEQLQIRTTRPLSFNLIRRRLLIIWTETSGSRRNFDFNKLLTCGVGYFYRVQKFPEQWTTTMNNERYALNIPLLRIEQVPMGAGHSMGETLCVSDASDSQSLNVFTQNMEHTSSAPLQEQNYLEEQPGPSFVRESMTKLAGANEASEAVNGDQSSGNDSIDADSTAGPTPFVQEESQLMQTPAMATHNLGSTPSPTPVTSLPDAAEPVPMANVDHNKQAIVLSSHARRTHLWADSMSLNDMLCWILKRIDSGDGVSMQDCQRLKSIYRTMQEPCGVFKKLVEDLLGLETRIIQYKEIIDSVVGSRSFLERTGTLGYPSQRYIEAQWENLREGIKGTIGNECQGPLPHLRALDGLAVRAGLFVSGDLGEESFKEWAMPYLRGPQASSCAVQTFVTALLVRWLFACPSTTLNQENGEKLLKVYKMIQESDGIEAVKNLDLIATKMLYDDKDLQRQAIQKDVNTIVSLLKKVSSMSMPPIQIGDPAEISSWVQDAIELKQQLIVSSKEYTIFFCSLDEDFDRTFMRAEDEYGRRLSDSECIFAKVKLCLFPAIAQCSTSILTRSMGLSAALASRKPFFTNKRRDTIEIISKAVVLVEKDDVFMSGVGLGGDPM